MNQSNLSTIVVIDLVYSIIVIEFYPTLTVSSRCVSLWQSETMCECLSAEFKLAGPHTTHIAVPRERECDLYGIGSQPIENAEVWRMHYDLNRKSLKRIWPIWYRLSANRKRKRPNDATQTYIEAVWFANWPEKYVAYPII